MTPVSPVGGEVDVTRLREVAEGTREVWPYAHGDDVDGYCGKACGRVVKHVRMSNHNNPDSLVVFCSTRGCSCSMKVSDLPKRFRISTQRWSDEATPKRVLALLARLEAAESARDEALAVVEVIAAALQDASPVVTMSKAEIIAWAKHETAALTPSAPTEETQA